MKNVLKEGFERAKDNADILELAEWGMNDYKQLINLCEKMHTAKPHH